jgi:hypothetical protein
VAVAGLVVATLGAVVSVFALIYAAQAAHRSERLLKRLVIDPFRDLDFSYAELNEDERRGLLALYDCTSEGRQIVDAEAITKAGTQAPDLSPVMLAFLVGQEWLKLIDGATYRFNRDRLPYLHFVVESEGGSGHART